MTKQDHIITITGHEAIELAERTGCVLAKCADPTEGARESITVEEAYEIAREDPSLVYARMDEIEFRAYAVTSAANLDDLCDALTELEGALDEGDRLEDVVDICGLPTYSANEPDTTRGPIWSYDDTRALYYETSGTDRPGTWSVSARDDLGGE